MLGVTSIVWKELGKWRRAEERAICHAVMGYTGVSVRFTPWREDPGLGLWSCSSSLPHSFSLLLPCTIACCVLPPAFYFDNVQQQTGLSLVLVFFGLVMVLHLVACRGCCAWLNYMFDFCFVFDAQLWNSFCYLGRFSSPLVSAFVPSAWLAGGFCVAACIHVACVYFWHFFFPGGAQQVICLFPDWLWALKQAYNVHVSRIWTLKQAYDVHVSRLDLDHTRSI